MNRLYHSCIENMNSDCCVTKRCQGWGQSASVVPLVSGTCFVQCEVTDEDVMVLLPGVDHDTAPACVLIEHHLLLLLVRLEDPLDAGVMDGALHHLTEETDLTALVVVEIC